MPASLHFYLFALECQLVTINATSNVMHPELSIHSTRNHQETLATTGPAGARVFNVNHNREYCIVTTVTVWVCGSPQPLDTMHQALLLCAGVVYGALHNSHTGQTVWTRVTLQLSAIGNDGFHGWSSTARANALQRLDHLRGTDTNHSNTWLCRENVRCTQIRRQ